MEVQRDDEKRKYYYGTLDLSSDVLRVTLAQDSLLFNKHGLKAHHIRKKRKKHNEKLSFPVKMSLIIIGIISVAAGIVSLFPKPWNTIMTVGGIIMAIGGFFSYEIDELITKMGEIAKQFGWKYGILTLVGIGAILYLIYIKSEWYGIVAFFLFALWIYHLIKKQQQLEKDEKELEE